jgi:hypothetical protein
LPYHNGVKLLVEKINPNQFDPFVTLMMRGKGGGCGKTLWHLPLGTGDSGGQRGRRYSSLNLESCPVAQYLLKFSQ